MKYSLAGVSVMIACPVGRDLPWQTVQSFMETVSLLTARGIDYDVQFMAGCSLVDKARSHLAHLFLKSGANRLFWIDSDMAWDAESFVRILNLSTVMDVVGASYPLKRDDSLDFVVKVDANPVRSNEHGCIPVAGMGLGFTCCRREVIERLAANAPKVREKDNEVVPMIFCTDIKDGQYRGEDIVFFDDCRRIGAGVWCDPSIHLGHIGSKEYHGALAGAMRQEKKQVG